MRIPLAALDTLFLDAGNTLLSVDFAWVADELGRRGVATSEAELERAEAAARPRFAEQALRRGATEGLDAFALYLDNALDGVEAAASLAAPDRRDLLRELGGVLRPGGRSDRLWSRVMPRVPEALRSLRDQGLRLVVVSNSDGTVERGLTTAGLRGFFDHVVDSHRVGVEKPDAGIFQAALARSGSRPERTLHVGDMHGIDVLGARGAGLHALLLDPFGDWDVDDCDVLPDLFALAEVLAGARRGG